MPQERIAVFDALDTIQGYAGASLGASKRFYQNVIAAANSLTVEELLERIPYEEQLRMTFEEQEKGNLTPTMLPRSPDVIELVKSHEIKPIVVTADIPESAENTLRPFVEAGLINQEDVHAINYLGSKKDPQTWTRARQELFPDTDVQLVFEDTPENLEAALETYETAKGYLVTTEPTLVTQSDRIVRGDLYHLRSELERSLQARE
jgi:beta-phosphoglucomutase-like phosphatase (HAD superfamily)